MLQISQPRDVDQGPLEEIVNQAENTVLMFSSFIRNIGPTSRSSITF